KRDPAMATGAQIVVEQRTATEVTGYGRVETAPAGTAVFNPAFDVTPADLVTAVVTETGVVYRNVDRFDANGRAVATPADVTASVTTQSATATTTGATDSGVEPAGAIAPIARQLYGRGWM